jgi:hypothetical protein
VSVRAGIVCERKGRALWVAMRPGTVRKGGLSVLRMRVRARKAQRTRKKALWTGKTGGGFRVKVRAGTV